MNSNLIDVPEAGRAGHYLEPPHSREALAHIHHEVPGGRRLPIRFGPVGQEEMSQETFASSRIRPVYDFEGLLVSILTGFVRLPSHQIQTEIGSALGRVCSFLGLHRATFWRSFPQEPGSFQLTQQWVGLQNGLPLNESEATPSSRGQQVIPLGTSSKACLPWITEQARLGKITMFSCLRDLPPEATEDRFTLERFGTKSSVILPVLVQNQSVGALSFDMLWTECPWPGILLRRLERVAEIFADLTARILVDEATKVALRDLDDLHRALNAHAVVVTTDAQGTITSVNDKFCTLSKYPREELLGQNHRIMNSGHHSKEFFQQMWSTIARGDVWQGEITNRAKDGSFYSVSTTIVPLLDETGKPRQYLAIRADISERKLAEEALKGSYNEIKQLKDRLQAESEFLKTEIKINLDHGEIIGRGRGIRKVLHQVEQVAPAECAVLINGETGTGKELIAREIHHLSQRKERVMVLVNCAALPSGLVESELFGRERGAYTGALTSQVGRFEIANNSTIFLDEVGELSLEVQAKLLRVLQEGEFQRLGSPKTHHVNVRVIAATNRDLAAEVRKGKFREDLYYRLRVFPIEIPPLRDRVEDIPLLVFSFMEEFSVRMGKKITKVSRKTMEALQSHPWPGNIRELRNVIEHGVILTTGDTLKVSSLGEAPSREAQPITLAEAEREHILKTLESAAWRIKGPHGAARRLDLQPSTLYSRMQKLGIPHRRQKDQLAAEG